MAEQSVDGADFVETHFVDQLLEYERIVGEKVDAPLPVIESNRTTDDLFDFSGIAAADESVIAHLAGALFDREFVPVLVFAAAAVHGIEARITVRRNLGVEAWPNGFFVALELASDLRFPLVGMGLDALVREFLVDL